VEICEAGEQVELGLHGFTTFTECSRILNMLLDSSGFEVHYYNNPREYRNTKKDTK